MVFEKFINPDMLSAKQKLRMKSAKIRRYQSAATNLSSSNLMAHQENKRNKEVDSALKISAVKEYFNIKSETPIASPQQSVHHS